MPSRIENRSRTVLAGGLLGLGLLLLGMACEPPVTQVDLGTIPTEAPSTVLASAQTRSLPMPKDQAFPKALDVLLDMGFQIRCASQDSGQINVSKSWIDASGSTLSLEATLLLRAGEAGSSWIRMSAVGSWKYISFGGTKSADADVSGMAVTDDPTGYRQFLDRLVAGICPPAK